MNILGISAFYHDSSAALVQDGVLVAAGEEERFSRKKHDHDFPSLAVDFCLRRGGISVGDIDYVVFYEKPFTKFERIMQTSMATYPRGVAVFRAAMQTWLMDKLWIKAIIKEKIGVPASKIMFSDHHLAHAASSFYCSPFEKAALLTVDGVGEWTTSSRGIGEGKNIHLSHEMRFPHSLGLLYSAFTAFLGFEVNEGEYKVMGMAPYGVPKYLDKVWKLMDLAEDGSFRLKMEYFKYTYSLKNTYNSNFVRLFGAPRTPETFFFTKNTGFPSYFGEKPSNYDALCAENQHYADIAASIQAAAEEIMLRMARSIHKETGLTDLCLAGGVALNCVANGRILRETPIKRIFINPGAGDGGGAVGAAFHLAHQVLGESRKGVLTHAYLGEEYNDGQILEFLQSNNIAHEHVTDEAKLIERTVEALTSKKVVGWHQGRFEFGPRALGSRSIIADPRSAEMKDIVNTKIKFREPYRPFAPSLLEEAAEEYFDMPGLSKQPAARFMLLVMPVKKEKQEIIPAVSHMGTGRLQSVIEETNPRYYRLIKAFGKATGVPVVMNTSFNLRGEPIVNTPANAYRTFKASEMDLLVVGNYLVRK
ncbi:MAG: carbamoyltransferase N-terminal domain-containing protein [Verrucomicrobiae bacterium]|nr:carbamoyltransferase N-terminal domain-containing protein [Verrucomicrobiae bacterium]